MTGFNTQVGGGLYRIQIETDRSEVFNVIQDMARAFVDTERTSAVVVSKKEKANANGVSEHSSVGCE